MPKPLITIVQEMLDAAVLPLDAPVKLWIGVGSCNPCTVCGLHILAEQTEYEPQYTDGRTPIRLHGPCHDLWLAERRRRGFAGDDC